MDFFEHQDRARRNSFWLIVYFLFAIAMVVLSVYAAAIATLSIAESQNVEGIQTYLWSPELFLGVSTAVLLVILTASFYKIWMIGSGGEHIALALGGQKVPSNSNDLEERILLNVVEEMALASGTPVPPVYVMNDEMGINAFAAGTTPQNAVIGVTRGTLRTLSRSELQGVIAHEFSHILNGDMRLNIRLMGLLHGILIISLIGFWIFRILGSSSSRTSSDSKKGEGAILIAVAIFGAALMAIGYIGVFFAQLIKSAVSRQREFLADASAVQFTRDPDGIAGALKKIGGWKQASKLVTPNAEEASHMFFGSSAMRGLFATHPPLMTRIQRVDGSFRGPFAKTEAIQHGPEELIDPRSLSMRISAFNQSHREAQAGASSLSDHPNQAIEHIGDPDAQHIEHAHSLVDSLEARLADDLHDPLGAVAAICGLLLAPSDNPDRQLQIAILEQQSVLGQQADQPMGDVLQELKRIQASIDKLAPEQRLPVACMALPALHQMSTPQIRRFHDLVEALIMVDRKVTLFEYAVQRFVRKRLLLRLEPNRGDRPGTLGYTQLRSPFLIALSAVAHACGTMQDPDVAFAAGIQAFSTKEKAKLLPKEQCTLKLLDRALDELANGVPKLKRQMLLAFSACIASDNSVTIEEAEMLRIFSDALGCPVPPIIKDIHV